jgi:hypothetical protein
VHIADPDALVPDLHLGPLAPDLGELVDAFEGDGDGLFKDLARRFEVGFGAIGLGEGDAALLEKLGVGDEEAGEAARRLARADRLDRSLVGLVDL